MSESLEEKVERLEHTVDILINHLTGMRQYMEWGFVQWGKDGLQFVGDHLKAKDCPEVGGTVINANSEGMEDNSIFKVSGRWNGNELSLYQLKRARGFDHSYGPEVGMHQWSCNIGGGSGDKNMFDNLFLLPDRFVSKVPIEAPNMGNSGGSGTVYTARILRAPGGETELHMQGDGNLVTYDVRRKHSLDWIALWSSNSGIVNKFKP